MEKLQANYIKNSIHPIDFYNYELPGASLKRYGWNDGGLCPFHGDNQPGSFRINTDNGGFVCYACGTKGGDILAFTMQLHGLCFREALEKLSNDWGVS
jgi:DNA primase